MSKFTLIVALISTFASSLALARSPMNQTVLLDCNHTSRDIRTNVKIFQVRGQSQTIANYSEMRGGKLTMLEGFNVRLKSDPARIGAPTVYAGKGFSLTINFTTRPGAQGSRIGALVAELNGRRVVQDLVCAR